MGTVLEQTLKIEIDNLFKHDFRIFINAEISYTHLLDYALQFDDSVLKILSENVKTKNAFFKKIGEIYVFDYNALQNFIKTKCLDGSFTHYKNRIGLSDGVRFIKESRDIVINFPFKDCILEGGQTKEESSEIYFEYLKQDKIYKTKIEKRKEIFFNQIIAKDEIDRLFTPKSFCNFKRYSRAGIFTPLNFNRKEDGTIVDNLVIKGNNLLALHSLKSQFKNKVKLIYIDPPYNTGNDSFNYNDKFNHSTWLVFMKNRLEVAKDFLREDGVIFVQCDDNEQAYLKILMDEIFGRENFVTTLHIEMSTTQGMKVASAQKGNIVKNGEYCIIFSKNGRKNIMENIIYDLREFDNHYSYFFDGKKYCKLKKILFENEDIKQEIELLGLQSKTIKELYNISQKIKNFILENADKIYQDGNCDIVISDSVLQKINTNFPICYESNNRNYNIIKTTGGKIRQLIPLSISLQVASDIYNTYGITKIRGDFWKGYYLDMGNVSKEGLVRFESGKKSERLISDIIKMTTRENDIVMDFHLGSGTTAAVAHKMKRQYIAIEQMDYIQDIVLNRLHSVIEGEQSGVSKVFDWNGGGEFIYMEMAKHNMQCVKKINACNSLEELKKLFDKMYLDYFLNYNLSVKKFKQEIVNEEAFKNLGLDKQKQMFLEMLDLNQMYVCADNSEDGLYALSEDDINLTNLFYGLDYDSEVF